jgi:dihydroorotate dehydrogenase
MLRSREFDLYQEVTLMKLRGIEFGNVLGASGVQGFFGEGYPFHRLPRPFGFHSGDDITFVSKTATLDLREGNMPLKNDYTPRVLFPRCIKARPWRGTMLNAVGLSNPGLKALLGTGQWQRRTTPFFISITSVADEWRIRIKEYQIMRDMIDDHRHNFHAPFGLQVNLSCPNTNHRPSELIAESVDVLEVLSGLNVPLMPKYSIAAAPIPAIMELGEHPFCDAVCFSNTVPFGWKGINWKRAWGSDRSPLAHLGGGGLSGRPLAKRVCEYIDRLRSAGFTKPINGGGGILSPREVEWYHMAGANSIFFGTVIPFASLFPWSWNVDKIIKKANSLTWE